MNPPRLVLNMTVGALIAFLILLVALAGSEAYTLNRIADTQTRDKQHECDVRASVQSVLRYFDTLPGADPRTHPILVHANELLTDKTCPGGTR